MLASALFLLLSAWVVCGAIVAATLPEGVLRPWWKALDELVRRGMFPSFLAKGLLLCEICLASIWGNLTWLGLSFWPELGMDWTDRAFLLVPLWSGTAFLNFVTWTLLWPRLQKLYPALLTR